MNKLKIITVGISYVLFSQSVLNATVPDKLDVNVTIEPQCTVSCTDISLGNIVVANYGNGSGYFVTGGNLYYETLFSPTKGSSTTGGTCSVTCPTSVTSITPKITSLELVSAPDGVNGSSGGRDKYIFSNSDLLDSSKTARVTVSVVIREPGASFDSKDPINLTDGTADFSVQGYITFSGSDGEGSHSYSNVLVPGTYVFRYSVSIDY